MSENNFVCINCHGVLQTRVIITHSPFNKDTFSDSMLNEDYELLYKSELHFIEITCHKCGSPKVDLQDLLLLTKVGKIVLRQASTGGDFYKENNLFNKEELCQTKV